MSNSKRLFELRREADWLATRWGAESRHWSINPDAGTVRHHNGDLIAYLSDTWVSFPDGGEFNWIIPPPVLTV